MLMPPSGTSAQITVHFGEEWGLNEQPRSVATLLYPAWIESFSPITNENIFRDRMSVGLHFASGPRPATQYCLDVHR